VSFVARCQQLRNGDLASPLPQFGKSRDRLVDLGLAALRLRHEAGDCPAVTGNDNGFTALDCVEYLRQMRLRFRGLDLSHDQFLFD
jgi:hypothetical protein